MKKFTEMPEIVENLLMTAVGEPASPETIKLAVKAIAHAVENYQPDMDEFQLTNLIMKITGDDSQATCMAIMTVGMEIVRRQKHDPKI